MVLPLKLTQFYGHGLPRPRLYSDVKFNDHRVDPPPSVNDALLEWAQDAHWSMGGLSFKRMRMQGKIEGSIRRLRAEKEKSVRRKKAAEAVAALPESDSGSDEEDSEPLALLVARKRKRGDVEATPARRIEEKRGDDSPKMVPATQEKKKRGDVEATPARKIEETPKFVPATQEKKKSPVSPARAEKSCSDAHVACRVPASRQKRGSESVAPRRSPRSEGGNDSPTIVPSSYEKRRSTPSSPGAVALTRQAVKLAKERTGEEFVSKQAGRKSRVRKMLLKDDSSDSDDGIEEFLKQKDRPLRRSSRRKSGPDSDSEIR